MALLFSAVTVTANDDKIEMLVSGIPKKYDEMEGWTDFDDFVNLLREESEVSVHAEEVSLRRGGNRGRLPSRDRLLFEANGNG